MLDGLAVISHGHSTPTFDADIWLDPTLSCEEWATAVIDPELRSCRVDALVFRPRIKRI
jgi:hypothetical protein